MIIMRLSFGRVYGAPLALAVLNGVGLISALLADGFWDAMSWIALSTTVAVITWFVLRTDQSGPSSEKGVI
jgi:hypothetical protein